MYIFNLAIDFSPKVIKSMAKTYNYNYTFTEDKYSNMQVSQPLFEYWSFFGRIS